MITVHAVTAVRSELSNCSRVERLGHSTMRSNDQHQITDLSETEMPHEDIVAEAHDEQPSTNKRGVYGWLISGGVHASALALAWIAVTAAPRILDQDPPAIRTVPIDLPVKKEEKPKERALEKQPEIVAPMESETPDVPSTLDVPVEVSQIEDVTDANTSKGREEAVADSERGGEGFSMPMGAGGGGAGLMGNRKGGGHKRAAQRGGATPGSEGAVLASLRWFKRHQSANGSWESDKYYQNCTEGAKCEPGKLHDASDANVAMTGYAVLCFLGYGYDHKTQGPYKNVVKNGISWLLAAQKNDGYFGNRNYEHPVAVMALAEAYAMTADPELRPAVQKGIDQILAHQNQDTAKGADGYTGGLGWDYTKPNDRNDASVTGWNVMALKSALAGGLNVGKGMDGAKRWLDSAWQASNSKNAPIRAGDTTAWKDAKDITAYDQSRFFYTWHNNDNKLEGDYGRESIGLVCAIFLGHLNGDPMAESLANTVMATQMPKAFPTNTYYMYYNTMAIFQMGGERWKKWNDTVRDQLVNAQRKTTDCLDGSWDWEGSQFHGNELGRVLTTAYNTLSLEVYYRFAQVQELHKK